MIFLELVPKDIDEIKAINKKIKSNFNEITGINIPDILRVSNRSYDACINLAQEEINVIPHIRMIDFSENELLALCKKLIENNVNKILLVSGDPPLNLTAPIFNHKIDQMISLLKKELPTLSIFTALDPYRQSLKAEIEYCHLKLQAGSDGLFTQPIFDENLVELLLNQKFDSELFIGISPVTDEKSFQYWCNRNNAFFPKSFKLSIDYNIKLAKSIIEISKSHNQHNYLMPIKTDAIDYINGIFND